MTPYPFPSGRRLKCNLHFKNCGMGFHLRKYSCTTSSSIPVKMLNSWNVINCPGCLSKDRMIARYRFLAAPFLRPVIIMMSFTYITTRSGILIVFSTAGVLLIAGVKLFFRKAKKNSQRVLLF